MSKEQWVTVANQNIRHLWACNNQECDQGNPSVYISPTFYENNGTPVCDCDEDMVYSRTEVKT